MGKQRDLLPWIFGGLATAAVAIAIAVTSANRAPPQSPAAAGRTTPMVLAALAPTPVSPASTPAPAPPPAPTPAPAPAVATAPAPSAVPPPPSSQIWECTTNGQKTFANRPCGANAILRDVGPVNGMDPAPRLAPNRRYYPPPADDSYDYSDSDSSDYPPEYSDGAYPVLVGIPLSERRRATHTHRPPKQVRAPPARRY
jgi:hypothetical protein